MVFKVKYWQLDIYCCPEPPDVQLALMLAVFSFLYLKKIKISKIYGRFENFQNYTPAAPCLGDRGLSPTGWATGPKRKKKLHLGPGAQDALNSKLVKSI